MSRFLVVGIVFGVGLVACGSPPPAPPPQPAAAPPPASPIYTDAERITGLRTTPGAIWGLTAEGPIRWDRQTGRAIDEGARGAPKDATAIAVADGGLYMATPRGLSWRDAQGRWTLINKAPARAGVVDVVARKDGGAWVATPNAIASVKMGTLTVLAKDYRVRDLAVDSQGDLWVATHGHGVVALQGETFVEHTSAQGVCGNHVRHLSFGPSGRLIATCAEAPTLAVRDGGRWGAYRLTGVGASIVAAWPDGADIIIKTPSRWFRMRIGTLEGPARINAHAFDPTGQPAPPVPKAPAPPSVTPVAVPVAMPPSAPAPPTVTVTVPPSTAAVAAPPSSVPVMPPAVPKVSMASVIVRPPPVPMPPPIAPPPVADGLLMQTRAGVARMATPPAYRLEIARDLAFADTPPSASTMTPDGAIVLALPYRGLLLKHGTQLRRFVTGSLLPARPARLLVDQAGRAVIRTAGGRVYRYDGTDFTPWTLPGDRPILGISAGRGPAFALSYAAPAPPVAPTTTGATAADATPIAPRVEPGRLIVYRSDTQGPFTEVTRLALTGLSHPPQIGRVLAQGGQLSFPLFEAPTPDKRRGVGLARIVDGFARLEVWTGRLGYVGEGESGAKFLPDAWVNGLAADSAGVLYVATNAGLVRAQGATLTVFDENDFIDSEVMTDVAVDAEGVAWVGTLEGLGMLKGGKWTAVKAEGLEAGINAVATTVDGSVWVGTDAGLWRRMPKGKSKGSWQQQAVRGARGATPIKDLASDGKGGLWLLSPEGLIHWQAR